MKPIDVNIEKVIKGLECCAAVSGDECRKCPYSDECLNTDQSVGTAHLASNAIVLLKAQEKRINELEEKLRLLKSTVSYCKLDNSYCNSQCSFRAEDD